MNVESPNRFESQWDAICHADRVQIETPLIDEIGRLKAALRSIEARAGFVVGRSHRGMVNDLAVIALIASEALADRP